MGFWDLFRSKKSRERRERRAAITDAILEEFSETGVSRREVRALLKEAYKQIETGDSGLTRRMKDGAESPADDDEAEAGDIRKLFGSSLKRYGDEQLAELVLQASQAIVDQSDEDDVSHHIKEMASDISHVFFGEGQFGIPRYGIFTRLEINFARAQIKRVAEASPSLGRYASSFIADTITLGLADGYRFETRQDGGGRRVYTLPRPPDVDPECTKGVCFVVEGVGQLLSVRFAERIDDIELDITVG